MNKFQIIAIMLVLCGSAQGLRAQNYTEINFYSDNYSNSGMSIIYGYAFKSFTKQKKEKVIDKEIAAGIRLSFYNRAKNHTALIGSPFLRYQKVFNSGFLIQPEIGLGYMFKKNNIPTYEYIDGSVKTIQAAGNHRIYPSFSFGVGYSFYKKKQIPLLLSFRPGIACEIPNNISSLIHFQSEIGITYLFGNKVYLKKK